MSGRAEVVLQGRVRRVGIETLFMSSRPNQAERTEAQPHARVRARYWEVDEASVVAPVGARGGGLSLASAGMSTMAWSTVLVPPNTLLLDRVAQGTLIGRELGVARLD